jgi:hypothetical protein
VAIYRLLQEGSFDPEAVERLAAAYEAALEMLHLPNRSDPVTDLVAAKIIQVYRLGEHDPAKLCARALRELGFPIPDK